MSTWSRLRPLLRHQRRLVAGLVATSMLTGLAEAGILATLAAIAATLARGSSHVDIDAGPLHASIGVGALLAVGFGLALARLCLQGGLAYLPARIGTDTQSRLRSQLFGAFSRASWTMQSRDREGHLQELMTDQVALATAAALWMTVLITAAFTFLMLMLSALLLNPLVALIVVVVSAGLFALMRPLSGFGRGLGRQVSRTLMDHAGGVGEAVRLAEETAVFGVGEAQRERIDRFIVEVQRPGFRATLLAKLVPGIYQGLIFVFVLIGLTILYLEGAGQVGSLGAVVLVLVRAGTYGQQAQGANQSMNQTLPALERIQDAVRRYEASAETEGARRLERIERLAFEDVGFAYEADRPVLSGIGFEVAGGEAIGIVGPSGAGKSSLVQILLRLRAPDRGRYLVDGAPVEEIAGADWHRLVAYVPQEPRLLHASVADNIRFYRELDDGTVREAARLAGIDDEVESWPRGYETVVGPRADAISGGQQQRICLARALAGHPQMLVLDEPTSALDPHSEALIQESLAAIQHRLTLFVVAHRMSTLEICERVMVIVDGRLEAFDAAAALKASSAYYRSASALAAAGAGTLPASA
jgi:ABC-type multidrug transport system fused ATPase/permease subunit